MAQKRKSSERPKEWRSSGTCEEMTTVIREKPHVVTWSEMTCRALLVDGGADSMVPPRCVTSTGRSKSTVSVK